MITLKKTPGKDFIILNISDPQLGNGEWEDGHKNRQILTDTLKELVARVKPDLITVSGDLAWAGHTHAYRCLADLLDSCKTPWAPVWGNHDNQNGPEAVDAVVNEYLTHEYCIYEKGDPALGNGNYVIAIEEDGRVVEGVIMMDSHDRMPYTNDQGETTNAWAKLIPEQLVWYREQVAALEALGCHDTTMVMHIPIYAYRPAFAAAFKSDLDPAKITIEESYTGSCWNDGYKNSFGVRYEGIASYPADEGAFDVIRELGSTKTVISGHDHVNNTVINYEGVTLIYSMKIGPGCYWNPVLNGGTVLRITSDGVAEIRHEYVEVK